MPGRVLHAREAQERIYHLHSGARRQGFLVHVAHWRLALPTLLLTLVYSTAHCHREWTVGGDRSTDVLYARPAYRSEAAWGETQLRRLAVRRTMSLIVVESGTLQLEVWYPGALHCMEPWIEVWICLCVGAVGTPVPVSGGGHFAAAGGSGGWIALAGDKYIYRLVSRGYEIEFSETLFQFDGSHLWRG